MSKKPRKPPWFFFPRLKITQFNVRVKILKSICKRHLWAVNNQWQALLIFIIAVIKILFLIDHVIAPFFL